MVKSPKKQPAKIAAAKPAFRSETPHSPSSSSKCPRFDIISSKVPRQQRTHATYRKDPDTLPSADPSPRKQAASSPSAKGRISAFQPLRAERSLGSNNDASQQASHSSARKLSRRATSALSRPQPLPSSECRPQAQSSAALMLQANAVLEALDHTEATEAVAAAAAASSEQHSKAMPESPVLPSPHPRSPRSPIPPRSVRSASPQRFTQSQEPEQTRHRPGNAASAWQSLSLQHRSLSMPNQIHTASFTHSLPTSPYSLSHSLDQLRQACVLHPATSGNGGMQQQGEQSQQQRRQQQQREKLPKQLRLTIKSPTVLLQSKAEPVATQIGSGTDATLPKADPDAAEGPQGQSQAQKADGLNSPARVSSLSQDRLARQTCEGVGSETNPCRHQDPTAAAPAAATVVAASSGEPVALAGQADVSLPAQPAVDTAHPSSEPTAKDVQAAAEPQPAVSDTAATRGALSEAPLSSLLRAGSAPPGDESTLSINQSVQQSINQHSMFLRSYWGTTDKNSFQ